MLLSRFDFELPPELIAQKPLSERSASRLLRLDRYNGAISHHVFGDLVHLLNPGDLLVLNETQVIPARLLGKKSTGGKAELLLLRPENDIRWQALVKPARSIRVGSVITFAGGIACKIVGDSDVDGGRIVEFESRDVVSTLMAVEGKIPLPPYIDREANEVDKSSYQTVYARVEGAVAAPTAGLHFTKNLFSRLAAKGVETTKLVLHVGLGTFRPVAVEKISDHTMHSEFYSLPQDTADKINLAKSEGRRVIAVGTTSARTLETLADENGGVKAGEGWSDIFIYPPYSFKVVDGLITNFHLPKSTLLMLVSALAGRENILDAYRTAIAEKYRFYSYGDAMLIL